MPDSQLLMPLDKLDHGAVVEVEAVLDGETGLVVRDPSDPNALADAVDRLISDPRLASRQGQAARQRAESLFGYDVLAARLMHALDGMAGS